jgi:hypothetical protein
VIVQDPTGVDLRPSNSVISIRFAVDRTAHVTSFDSLERWHTVEFVSSDMSESLPLAFGTATTAVRAFWSLGRGKDKIWLYVGTDSGFEAVKKTRFHRVGNYQLEMPPQ